jgi:hypothetical protein
MQLRLICEFEELNTNDRTLAFREEFIRCEIRTQSQLASAQIALTSIHREAKAVQVTSYKNKLLYGVAESTVFHLGLWLLTSLRRKQAWVLEASSVGGDSPKTSSQLIAVVLECGLYGT